MPQSKYIFEINKNIGEDSMVSKIRVNRDYLLSKYTAEELNTYTSFEPFRVFNDAFPANDQNPKVGTPGVRSLFNAAGAVVVGTSTGNVDTEQIISKRASEWRISNNVPLMDNIESRMAIKRSSDCSVKSLVEDSSKGYLGRETYAYSDFMYCKHLGRISNNYLITLRRFPLPVDDYISTLGIDDTRIKKEITSQNCTSIGCMVTWMGTPGNEMANLLKYSYSLPFRFQEAEWQDAASGDANQGPLNGIAAAFDGKYREQYQLGMAGTSYNAMIDQLFKVPDIFRGDPPYTNLLGYMDKNKVYGPVDAIKGTYIRDSKGLTFDQKFTVTFDYELRSYNGINGRQAMLDLLSNILNVTYSTGTFWGGGFKGSGAHQNNIFANMQIFKFKGGFTDFIDQFSQDLTTVTSSFSNALNTKYNGSLIQMMKAAINSIGGMLMGGLLNKLGRPNKVQANSLLSPAPIGFWHLTIGNPHHPIMSVGNLVLTNTTVEHYGPLGLDDFPTGIKVTCELERGKPRDIRDIEKIYMHGNDRIYTSMGPKVFDMYRHAKDYKSNKKMTIVESGNSNTEPQIADEMKEINSQIPDLKNMQNVLQKYFGHTDTYSIYVSACEQEMGAHKKKKTGSGSGSTPGKNAITY